MHIDDIDVFDSMRALLDEGIDLDDRAAVERKLINPYEDDPSTSKRFVDWCIKAAKANKAAGGLRRHAFGGDGFVPEPIVDPVEIAAVRKDLTTGIWHGLAHLLQIEERDETAVSLTFWLAINEQIHSEIDRQRQRASVDL